MAALGAGSDQVKGDDLAFQSLYFVGLLLFVASYWILWRTSFGLRLRSCGESPAAAESLGVNVYLYKFVAVIRTMNTNAHNHSGTSIQYWTILVRPSGSRYTEAGSGRCRRTR